jgi:hypothetical protein
MKLKITFQNMLLLTMCLLDMQHQTKYNSTYDQGFEKPIWKSKS